MRWLPNVSAQADKLAPQLALIFLLCAGVGQAQTTLAHAEQLWHAGSFDDAKPVFEALLKAEPTNALYRIRYGDMFAERFNPTEAVKLYEEALAIDPKSATAYVKLANVYADEFSGKANEAAAKALEIDPKQFHAHEIIARVALEDDDHKKATEEADAALAIEPTALEATAIHVAMDLLADHESSWTAKLGNRAQGYEIVAHFFVINRRYDDGIVFYRKAIAIDPSLWSAHSQLGLNLMRLGREEEARKELELAYENHFRDATTVNSLTVLDRLKTFVTFTTPTTVLKMDPKEAEALHPYFEQEMLRAISVYEKKYNFRINEPIRVEVFPNHDDFAVRAIGLPGVGILGVTFNDVVAMDSPSGRPPGQFHWAATLWHELSHVYILTMTNSRVPRWFTEGLAVHEETATTPDWGDRITPEILKAIRDKKLLPLANIDRGFVHPSYPAQVIVSYFQAGKMCDYIAQRWGESKLVDIAREFGKNRPTLDVMREQLKIDPEQFDKDFLASIEKETLRTVSNFEAWAKDLSELHRLSRLPEHNNDDLITKGRALEAIYPDYIEAGTPYLVVAKACLEKKDNACAMDEYKRYSEQSGRDADAIKEYAQLLQDAGKLKEAEAALGRLNFISPLDTALHERLGNLFLKTGDAAGAAREFKVLVALNPIDKAGAHYNLARALQGQGSKDKAREEALTALEAAPNFRPAQKLLLELSGPGEN